MVLNNIGVVGAGMMGREIALVFALAGKDVTITDTEPARLDAALTALSLTLDKGANRGFWPKERIAPALASIRPTLRIEDFVDREIVVEAVFEDEAVKAQVLERLGTVTKADCLIASNTSSISITVLASYLPPERRTNFLGTHFFSPVSRMRLVEVIPGLDTAPAAVAAAMEVCRAVGKEPVNCKDVVGFAVNRLLHAYLVEAVRLVEEGVASPADIDLACRLGLGHPIGPFEMMDLVTNRLTAQVQEILGEAYGERFRPRPLLKQMVKAGYDGRRTKRGWHRYP